MPAYVIAEVEVTDAEAYKLYADKAPGVTLPAGGRYLARAGHVRHWRARRRAHASS